MNLAHTSRGVLRYNGGFPAFRLFPADTSQIQHFFLLGQKIPSCPISVPLAKTCHRNDTAVLDKVLSEKGFFQQSFASSIINPLAFLGQISPVCHIRRCFAAGHPQYGNGIARKQFPAKFTLGVFSQNFPHDSHHRLTCRGKFPYHLSAHFISLHAWHLYEGP